jgi:hypothetical protein
VAGVGAPPLYIQSAGWSSAFTFMGTLAAWYEDGLLFTVCQVLGSNGSTPALHAKPPSGRSIPPLPKYAGVSGR